MKELAPIASAAAVLALLCTGHAHAETFRVTSAADDGSPGTLRWAIGRNNAQPRRPTEK